ncbi:hypothetical protein [Caldanaerobacter sp.]
MRLDIFSLDISDKPFVIVKIPHKKMPIPIEKKSRDKNNMKLSTCLV